MDHSDATAQSEPANYPANAVSPSDASNQHHGHAGQRALAVGCKGWISGCLSALGLALDQAQSASGTL